LINYWTLDGIEDNSLRFGNVCSHKISGDWGVQNFYNGSLVILSPFTDSCMGTHRRNCIPILMTILLTLVETSTRDGDETDIALSSSYMLLRAFQARSRLRPRTMSLTFRKCLAMRQSDWRTWFLEYSYWDQMRPVFSTGNVPARGRKVVLIGAVISTPISLRGLGTKKFTARIRSSCYIQRRAVTATNTTGIEMKLRLSHLYCQPHSFSKSAFY